MPALRGLMSGHKIENCGKQDPQPPESQLVEAARSGDPRAFAELCQRYGGMLKGEIFRIVRHREDAEDVLQETFLSAYQHLHSFRGASKFSSWLMKIGVNSSLMLLRKRKKRFQVVSDQVRDEGRSFEITDIRDPGPDPEQLYIWHQSQQKLRVAIKKLPPRLNRAIALYYGNDRGLKNAAKTLGITEAAAKSRVMRARSLLWRRLFRQGLSDGDRHL
jgi:RNA polymerase sigma-70 factor, ECF subfamily